MKNHLDITVKTYFKGKEIKGKYSEINPDYARLLPSEKDLRLFRNSILKRNDDNKYLINVSENGIELIKLEKI